MPITDKEKEMLEKERDEIKQLTLDIIQLQNDPKNSTKIKQDVIGIQAAINRIASYSNSKNYGLDNFAVMAECLLRILSINPPEEVTKVMEEEIRNPSNELLKKLKIKRNKFPHLPPNVAYPAWWGFAVDGLNQYCCYVNSIRFDFTKKGLKIVLPKITLPKNINIGNITNQ